MRVERVTAIALMLASPLVASCGDDGARDTERFRSTVYGYTLEYPNAWSVIYANSGLDAGQSPRTADGTVDILGRNADTRVSRMEPPGVLVAAQPIEPSVDTAAWAEEVQERVSFQKGCKRPDATEEITVDGKDAVLLTYNQCPETDGFLHYWVAAVHDGMGFHIVWFDDVGRADADRPALDELLRSFEFG